jgi:hypothetical protein
MTTTFFASMRITMLRGDGGIKGAMLADEATNATMHDIPANTRNGDVANQT